MKKLRKTSVLLMCLAILFLISACSNKTTTPNTIDSDSNFKIHFIDVGQADSILISSNGKNMLIDAGNNEDSKLIIDYIQKLNIKKLDYIIGTHPHEDHIGAMDDVIDSFNVDNVILPKLNHTTNTYKDVLTSIERKKIKVTPASSGISFNLGDAKCKILAPNNKVYSDINNYSIVLKVTYGNNSFLFTGDAENISENEMMFKGYNLKSDVLKVGHHGSDSSTSQKFLDRVDPKYAVISVGNDNDYGHPTQSTLKKLNKSNINILRTDKDGTIVMSSDGTNISTEKIKTNSIDKKVQDNNIVYITNNGDKYHKKGCRYIKGKKTKKIPLKDAQKDYSECSLYSAS